MNVNIFIGMKRSKGRGLKCSGFQASSDNRERRKKKNEIWSIYQLVMNCAQKECKTTRDLGFRI